MEPTSEDPLALAMGKLSDSRQRIHDIDVDVVVPLKLPLHLRMENDPMLAMSYLYIHMKMGGLKLHQRIRLSEEVMVANDTIRWYLTQEVSDQLCHIVSRFPDLIGTFWHLLDCLVPDVAEDDVRVCRICGAKSDKISSVEHTTHLEDCPLTNAIRGVAQLPL